MVQPARRAFCGAPRARSQAPAEPRQRATPERPSHRHLPRRSSANSPPRGAMICSPGQLEREWTLLAGGLDSGLDDGANFFGIDENDLLCLDSSLADDAEVQFVLDSSGEPMSHARVQKLRAPAQSPPAPPFRSSPRPRPLPINRPAAALPRPEPVPGPPVRRDDATAAAVRQRRAAPGHHGQHAAQAPALEPVLRRRGPRVAPDAVAARRPAGQRARRASSAPRRRAAVERARRAARPLDPQDQLFDLPIAPARGRERGPLGAAPHFGPRLPPVHLAVRALQAGGDRCLQLVPDGDQRPRQPPAGAASRHPPEILPASTRISRTTNLTHPLPSPRRSGRRARRRATRSRRSRAPGAPSKPTRSTRRSRSRSSRRRRPAAPRRRAPPSPPLAVASARTRSCRRRPPRRRAAARGGGRRRRSRRRARARAAPAPRRARVSTSPSRRSGEHDASTTQEFGAYREVRAACTRSEADPPATMCVIPALPP